MSGENYLKLFYFMFDNVHLNMHDLLVYRRDTVESSTRRDRFHLYDGGNNSASLPVDKYKTYNNMFNKYLCYSKNHILGR